MKSLLLIISIFLFISGSFAQTLPPPPPHPPLPAKHPPLPPRPSLHRLPPPPPHPPVPHKRYYKKPVKKKYYRPKTHA
ncbi:MAG TPA: hypothetical protein VK498_04760, partial [Ferruginibacter sp.]|nr:hypothetical protein [Ferruginibacter sp.]